MREVDLFEELDPGAGGAAERGRRPLAHAIHRQRRGLFESREEEAARGMRLMVIEDFQPTCIAEPATNLLLHPVDVIRQAAQDFTANGVGGLRMQGHPDLSGKLFPRIFVIGDAVDVGQADATLFEAETKGLPWQAWIVLDAGESLLLRGRDQLAVAQ